MGKMFGCQPDVASSSLALGTKLSLSVMAAQYSLKVLRLISPRSWFESKRDNKKATANNGCFNALSLRQVGKTKKRVRFPS